MKPQQLATLIGFLRLFNVQIYTQYGMSECNGVLGCRLLDINDTAIPIGYPLLNVQCLLIDEQEQIISNTGNPSRIGRIHIGGL